ncbi:Putative RNA binding protein [Aspergillus calidoustus]|uniref:Putative RNA binding protein n=1 Tax=Aspergillus calidoustus TaxID=454130 RepID=A0A0U5GYB3_ASPCI|nr:Putative RNA binding protein [Aspergillus calidoustus]
MSPPRERGRPTRPRGSEEEFVLFLQGIPSRCRWQELKDLVRQTALHIRQAVVYDDHHGFPTGLGQIIVKNEEEAWRTYHRLSTNGWEGQSLVVTLARTSSPTQPIAGPTKSPLRVIPPAYVAGYSTPPKVYQNLAIPPSPMSAESVLPPSPTYHSPEYVPVISPMAVAHQPFVQIYVDPLCQTVPALPNSPALQPSFYDPMGVGFIPTYAVPHQMHPPSIANNINSTPLSSSTPRKDQYNYSNPPSYPRHHTRRTILLHNLDPTTTPQELHTFLQRDVTIESCEVLHADGCCNNAHAARYRASARVTTRSADEARRAVALYNNAVFKGFRLRVKIDRSITPAAPCTVAPMHTTATSQSDFAVCETSQLQPTPPTSEGSSSDSDEFSQIHKDMQCEQVILPLSPKSKPIDRCGPLVVNGSGIGPTAAMAI